MNEFWGWLIKASGSVYEPIFVDVTSRMHLIWLATGYLAVILLWWGHGIARRKPVGLRGAWELLFPKSVYGHWSSHLDAKMWVVNQVFWWSGLATFLYTTNYFTGVFGSLCAELWGPPVARGSSSVLVNLAYSAVAILVAMDLSQFIAHYLQHKVPLFWEFHKVHHAAQVLNPLTNLREHPIDALLRMLCDGVLLGLTDALFQYYYPDVSLLRVWGVPLVWIPFNLTANLRHTHLWLSYPKWLSHGFVSPAMHQCHHGSEARHIDVNFGRVLSIWDWLAGTLYIPKERETIRFGIGPEGEEFNSVLRLYWLPFRKARALLFRTSPGVASGLVVLLILGGCVGAQGRPAEVLERPPARPTIRLVTHTALSGPLTPYADVARGAKAYFDSVNKAGGVHGADIELVMVDSKDDPATTRAEVGRLVEGGDVFGLFQPIGDPGQRAILDYLDERGVPTFFMGSGLSLYTQPLRRNVFVSNPAYKDFGRALARYAALHPYGKQRIGLIYLDRESGREFAEGVRELLGEAGTLVHAEATSFEADLAPVVERLRAQGVDTVIQFLLPAAVLKSARMGNEKGYAPRVMSNFMDLLVEEGGRDAEGVISAHWLVPVRDVANEAVEHHLAILAAHAPGVQASSLTVGGQAAAELMVEALRRAGPHPTRQRAIEAVESIHGWRCSLCLVPADLGPKDHRPYDKLQMFQVRAGRWEPLPAEE